MDSSLQLLVSGSMLFCNLIVIRARILMPVYRVFKNKRNLLLVQGTFRREASNDTGRPKYKFNNLNESLKA